jgi:hypothetical protein
MPLLLLASGLVLGYQVPMIPIISVLGADG